MDEEIMDMTTEEQLEPVNVSIVEVDVDIDDEEPSIATSETAETVAVEPVEEIEIEVDEAIGWAGGDNERHYSLLGRDDPNQHTIGAITGLREELDEIERIKTVYSDKFNVANYYEWEGATYSDYGYFVSLAPNTSKIKICDGLDILGVSVYDAGFVGGQNQEAPRGNSYGLIVTSGLVDVRCELDVQVGDYVVSNAYGYAKKSASDYGYRVLAKENKDGTEYVVILLGVQADKTNAIGEDLGALEQRVEVNEKNIVSAINVANQAYNKSAESANVSEEALRNALEALLNSEYTAEDMERLQESMSSTAAIVAQARALAEGAVTSAESMRDTAVKEANEALTDTVKLREEFAGMEDQITDIDGRVVIVTQKTTENGRAISGIQSKADEESARIDLLTSWQSDTKTAMASIEQKADENGAYIKSTVSNMDKYSVGPYSQAYGFTLEQAQDVLEIGMIYVPTSHKDLSAGTPYHTEIYKYDDNEQSYERTFTPGYLYKWGQLNDGKYGWITVDKNYNETNESNTSSMAVYFTATEPLVNGNFGYWYTDVDTVTGTTGVYEPYTLYKWELYVDESEVTQYHWVPVATLAGNSQNRAVSQIRQDSNSILAEVVDAYGNVAGFGAWLSETASEVQTISSWTKDPDGNQYNLATIKQTADGAGASITQVVESVGINGEVNAASIVTAVTNDESSIALLADSIVLNADNIIFEGSQFYSEMSQTYSTKEETNTAKSEAIEEANSNTDDKLKSYSTTTEMESVIDQKVDSIDLSVYAKTTDVEGKISTVEGKIALGIQTDSSGNKYAYLNANADKIKFDATKTIEIDATNFKLDASGNITASGGTIGGFTINSDRITCPAIEIDGTNIKSKIEEGTVFLSSVGRNKGIAASGNVTKPWMFIIGQNFGVTKKGELYASAGKIGDINIAYSDSHKSTGLSSDDLMIVSGCIDFLNGSVSLAGDESNNRLFVAGDVAFSSSNTVTTNGNLYSNKIYAKDINVYMEENSSYRSGYSCTLYEVGKNKNTLHFSHGVLYAVT